ncbi:hypothetical protein [Nonomuraea sp. NPDC049709]|uniref:hypothetical protein n=1 Tax=Nonomuraea sp. NPDC049709 TaxID=3154736 RepID=UPI00344211D0
MTKELEDDLRRVIGRAAESAPQAPSGLSTEIVGRSRRRRARTLAAVTALAVAVVAGGVAVTVRGLGDDRAHLAVNPAPSPRKSLAAQEGRPAPVEEVWPNAVWKIPAKLSDGRKFKPLLFIDDRTILLSTWSSFEKADAIYAYDLGTGDVRKIADIRTPKGVFASGYAVGEGRVVWQTIRDRRTEFWSVPITGGEPAAIATDAPVEGRTDASAVVAGKLAFSVLEGGVFTLPLDGGQVTPVAGADRHHILSWPWVGTPGDYTPDNEPSFEELLNVETGQTSRALVRPGEKFVRCGVTSCVGTGADEKYFHRLRDGSQQRELPQWAPLGLAYDRFMTIHQPMPTGGQALLDLTTGKSGDLGLRPDAKGGSVSVQPGLTRNRLVSYPLGDQYVIIDLLRI